MKNTGTSLIPAQKPLPHANSVLLRTLHSAICILHSASGARRPAPGAFYGRGFSLIELMIVIMIISVLAMIVTPRLLKVRGTACVTEADTVIDNINLAERILFHKDGKYAGGNGYEDLKEKLKYFEMEDTPKYFSYSVTLENGYTVTARALSDSCPGLDSDCVITYKFSDKKIDKGKDCP